jgi:hypothetical protein
MTEVIPGILPAEGPTGESDLKVCTECGREVPRLTRKMCGTCYMRARRGGAIPKRPPLDPEIIALLLPVPGTSESFAERVFTYVDTSGDCWEWTGATNKGYGVIGRGARGAGLAQAHRAVWELLVGPIPPGMELDHLCRVHNCCNPDHLEPVSPEENKRRGFGIAVLYAMRTTCEFGHPLDGIRRDETTGAQWRCCETCKRL